MVKQIKRIAAVIAAAAAFASCGVYAQAAQLSDWVVSEYQEASAAQLLPYSIVANSLQGNITREQCCELAVNLYKRLTDDELITPSVSPFTDAESVPVMQAYYYGIVSGTSETTFSPEKLVTREEFAKMLINTLNVAEVSLDFATEETAAVIDKYTDGSTVSYWATAPLATAIHYGFMNGMTETTLNPLDYTTREQAIASVNRAYNEFKPEQITMDVPTVTSPSDNSLIEGGDFVVSWTPMSNAVRYRVLIKTDDGKFVLTDDTTETSINILTGSIKSGVKYSVYIAGITADELLVFSMPVSFTYTDPSKPVAVSNAKVDAVLDEAAKYLGVPYVYGGSTPSGFDCSGFTSYVFKKNGITLSRSSKSQYANDGVYVKKSDLQPGDLVFFGTNGTVGHVGIYVGDGMMIHSPHTGDVVKYTSINSSYYTKNYIGAKRVLQ